LIMIIDGFSVIRNIVAYLLGSSLELGKRGMKREGSSRPSSRHSGLTVSYTI
jgi:hypothetical protein